jgi:hypothetical protein
MKSRRAVVLNTLHDEATKSLASATEKARQILRDSGFDLVEPSGSAPTIALLYVLLIEQKKRNAPRIAFLIGEGSKEALVGSNGEEVFDEIVCQQLTNSILIITAGLEDGTLAAKCTSGAKRSKACISYRDELVVPLVPFWKKVFRRGASKCLLSMFDDCVVAPLEELIKGSNVDSARRMGKEKWLEAATVAQSLDKWIAMGFALNSHNLDAWGSKSSLL